MAKLLMLKTFKVFLFFTFSRNVFNRTLRIHSRKKCKKYLRVKNRKAGSIAENAAKLENKIKLNKLKQKLQQLEHWKNVIPELLLSQIRENCPTPLIEQRNIPTFTVSLRYNSKQSVGETRRQDYTLWWGRQPH